MSVTRISAELAGWIFARDNGRCRACGMADPYNLVVDHIIPESLEGPTTPENLQTLCGFCNGCKGSTIVDSLPIRPGIVGFGDFAEVMQNRENFREHVAQCRKNMIDNAAKSARQWLANGDTPAIIRERLPKLVGNRNVQKVIFRAFRDDVAALHRMAE